MPEVTAMFPVEYDIPLIPEDIEVGDRLYNITYPVVNFGTVIEVTATKVILQNDIGGTMEISSNPRLSLAENLARNWAKPFDIARVKFGSRISVWDENEHGDMERFYGTITYYVPDREIAVVWEHESGEVHYRQDLPSGVTLEEALRSWELED